jgi:hypothetical protein
MTAPSILLKSNPPPPDGLHTIAAIGYLQVFEGRTGVDPAQQLEPLFDPEALVNRQYEV